MSKKAISKMAAIGIIIIVVVAALAGVAIYYMTRPKKMKAPPIKIGVMGPFTGPAAKTGEEFKRGWETAIEDLREQGLIPVKVDGVYRDIEVIWVDSESDPEKAIKAYEDALARGVEVFLHGWHSSVAMAVHEISTAHGIMHFGHMGATQFLCYKREENPDASRYWFKAWPCPPVYVYLYAESLKYFMDQGWWTPRNKKFAICVEDTDWGRGFGDGVKEVFERLGFECVHYDVFSLIPAPEVEFYPLLEKYKAADISLLIVTTTASASIGALLKQAREVDLRALIIMDGLGWFPDWYDIAGEASDYVISQDSPRAVTPEQKAWVERYKEKYGVEPSLAAAAQVYDLTMVFFKALNEAGTLDAEKLRSVLVDRPWKGLWQTWYWPSTLYDPEKQPWAHYMEPRVGFDYYSFPMVQYLGGKYYVISPPDKAERPFEMPPYAA